MPITDNEQKYLQAIRQKLDKIKELLSTTSLETTSAFPEWHQCLSTLKGIVGNAHNDMNTIACLMAKDYLSRNLPMRNYDALKKAHGAKGLDIDELTIDGQRVIAEIKTTSAFGHSNLRGPQKQAFKENFQRLQTAEARYKFFFVTDAAILQIVKRNYASLLVGVTLVLLPDEEEYTAT